MTQWEYKIIKLDSKGQDYLVAQTELYMLGKEGWDVINSWPVALAGTTQKAYAMLKKQVDAI